MFLDHLIKFSLSLSVYAGSCVLIPKWSLAWKLIHPHSHYLSMGPLSQVMNFNFRMPSKGWQTYQSHSIQNDITSHISSHLIFCQLKATDSLWKENWSDKRVFHALRSHRRRLAAIERHDLIHFSGSLVTSDGTSSSDCWGKEVGMSSCNKTYQTYKIEPFIFKFSSGF